MVSFDGQRRDQVAAESPIAIGPNQPTLAAVLCYKSIISPIGIEVKGRGPGIKVGGISEFSTQVDGVMGICGKGIAEVIATSSDLEGPLIEALII